MYVLLLLYLRPEGQRGGFLLERNKLINMIIKLESPSRNLNRWKGFLFDP